MELRELLALEIGLGELLRQHAVTRAGDNELHERLRIIHVVPHGRSRGLELEFPEIRVSHPVRRVE
ncbi:MAG: hypothetical protein AAB288_04340, partial [Acidobacteriota bacterium]